MACLHVLDKRKRSDSLQLVDMMENWLVNRSGKTFEKKTKGGQEKENNMWVEKQGSEAKTDANCKLLRLTFC